MKKCIKVTLVVIAGLMGIGLWYSLTEDYGIGVNSVGWLPREAHDITYLRSDLNNTAEFSIEREAFEKWCARRKMPLRELNGEGYHAVHRCLSWLEDRGVIPPLAEPNEGEAELRRAQRTVKALRDGDLFYEDRWDNGGGYTIGYDTKEKRGYYSFAHH